ncbi:MAG TPA: hypothetical protein VK031_01435 [Tissierellaceae bacterium]|nr:hypothetical protein [Tissierellaceae bacterium]
MFKSLYNLLATNDGYFKSEKQARFLLSKLGNRVVQNMGFNLGSEHNNKKVGNSAYRVFELDSKGVVSIVHHNAKGKEIIFERGGYNRYKAKQDRLNKSRKLVTISKDLMEQINDLFLINFKETALKAGARPEHVNKVYPRLVKREITKSSTREIIDNPLFSDLVKGLAEQWMDIEDKLRTM